VSNSEFEEDARLYASGHLSRRQFVNRMIAGGMTASAALAFWSATGGATASAAPGGSGALYGTPPGQGGTPPGQGGTPPPFSSPPPGLGGTPPGHGGTPPGQQRRNRNG
jgi:hypothetical protein